MIGEGPIQCGDIRGFQKRNKKRRKKNSVNSGTLIYRARLRSSQSFGPFFFSMPFPEVKKNFPLAPRIEKWLNQLFRVNQSNRFIIILKRIQVPKGCSMEWFLSFRSLSPSLARTHDERRGLELAIRTHHVTQSTIKTHSNSLYSHIIFNTSNSVHKK